MPVLLEKENKDVNKKSFRDTKNEKQGISLEFTKSKTPAKFNILLLIAALMIYILWQYVGSVAEHLNYHQSVQVNTVKKSTCFITCLSW